MDRSIVRLLALGWLGYLILPWYVLEDGIWNLAWLFDGWPLDRDYAPGLIQTVAEGRVWLWPVPLFLLMPLATAGRRREDPVYGIVLLAAGSGGLFWLLAQGFAIGIGGWEYAFLEQLFGPLDDRQFGLGSGALLVAAAFLFFLTEGIASRGAIGGDSFTVGAIGLVVALVSVFILLPILQVLAQAFRTDDGLLSVSVFAGKFVDRKIWGLDCLYSTVGCGAAWNSLFLAILVGFTTTALGLCFALVVTRTRFPYKRMLRSLTVLPIITPPFVIGLSIILLFGRSGAVTQFAADLFGIAESRWIYGLPGIWLAQMLAFTPIAFLVLIGVMEGVSPSLEEASTMLRARPWPTFQRITFPLIRPGLANAFLLGFIESMADFGNPLVLGGNYDVLSTEIFFAIVGAQNDQGMAAVLALVLLAFTLSAFYAQRRWLGRRSYVTITGKGDAGLPPPMPARVFWPVAVTTALWTLLTIVIYFMIVFGSFVEIWGLDHTLTFKHYWTAFSVDRTADGWHLSGSAWDSFNTTLIIAAVSAPLTAAIGLLTAWLLVRQRFAGREAFEFGTMLSFAIPGTVIGVSYIIAFNVPPIELTGTGAILVLSFIFRNMPVGVRAGIAAMSQVDPSLDEASTTLGAHTWTTIKRVVLPLLRPAIVAALVYSFVRAMTAISAVIFLVSAEYDMATTYIIGRVENNDYGIAIAYCTVLILVMLTAVLLVQLSVGQRRLGRRTAHHGKMQGEAA